MLAKAFARRSPEGLSYSVDPGWPPTKMGGPSAPGRIEDGVEHSVMVALGQGEAGWGPGGYLLCARPGETTERGGGVM